MVARNLIPQWEGGGLALVAADMGALQDYEAPEVVTYSEDEILQDIVVNCGDFSF
jgi:hypothetical protein